MIFGALTAVKLFFTGPKLLGMLSNVAGFVMKYWKQIAIVLMVGTLYYQNFSEERWFVPILHTIPTLQAEKAELQGALDAAVKANEVLANTIEARNVEIGKWKSVSERLERDNAKLEGTLEQMRVQTVKDVQRILDEEVPGSCPEAIDYLERAIDGDLAWPRQQSSQ